MIIRPTSVIICTHNRAALLPRVISQLRAQDYSCEAFEIIIVDNCSTDQTSQVVERFVAEPGVCVRNIKESRPGVTFARNRGAEEARYPYLAYLDDDCSVEPDWLSQLVSGFDLDDRVDIIAGRIIVDFDKQERPVWLEPRSEQWLGAYDFPGSQPRVLEHPLYICEGNMALSRKAWNDAGGFIGMDQFGSPHVAAQEIRVLLKRIEWSGGKVAFVPSATAHHYPGLPNRRSMLMRAYMHGVSDGILDYFLYRRPWIVVAYHIILDTAAMIIFFSLSAYSFLKSDVAAATYHLLRAVRRIGKTLSAMRLAGGWHRVRSYTSTHH